MAIPRISDTEAKMLERKPLIVIIYTLAATVALLFSTLLYTINDSNKRVDAERIKNDALSKEIVASYKEGKEVYKDLAEMFSPDRYYEKKYNHTGSNNTDSNNSR